MSYKFNPFTGQFDRAGAGALTLTAVYPLVFSDPTISAEGSRIKRTVSTVVTVATGYTQLFRAPLIGAGAGIIVEADAEAYIL